MTNGTNEADSSLNGELTEDQLFSEIQKSLREGSPEDLNKIMKSELVEDSVEETVKSVPESVEVLPTEEVKPAVTASTDTPQATTPTPAEEWLASLPQEVQDKVLAIKQERDGLVHKVKSYEGRVPALQRQNEEFKRKLQEQSRPASQAVTKPANAESTLANRIAQIKEVDPLLAEALQAMQDELVNPVREEAIARTEDIRQELRQKEDDQLYNREYEKLIAAVPQAIEVFKLPAYRQWVDLQTEGVQTLAASIYADDVLTVFEKFAKHMQATNPQVVAAPVSAPAPVSEKPVDTKALNVAEERARKLRGSAPSTVSGVAKAGDGIPEDPDALFAYYSAKIQKQEM